MKRPVNENNPLPQSGEASIYFLSKNIIFENNNVFLQQVLTNKHFAWQEGYGIAEKYIGASPLWDGGIFYLPDVSHSATDIESVPDF